MSDNIQKVLDSVQTSSFIGKFVRLKILPNRQFIGLCPFHHEKSPSFRVNDDKKFFYCFGCNKGGNIFTFLQDYKNIDFNQALNEIAQEYNIKLESFNSKKSDEIKTQQSFLTEICNIFQSHLFVSAGKEALNYLQQKRHLSLETIKSFKLGFCPKEADFLFSYFPDKITDLITFGLIGKRENGDFYSTFNDRIIFPILNTKSIVIGFGSRIYKKQQEEANFAKYINSKESDIFKKSKIIYGLEKVKSRKHPPIIVEGYFDVITMHQFGFNSAVAQMGTAFSDEQIMQLFALSNEVIFCYDSDDAGKKAEKRSIEIALPFLTPEKNISFISLEAKDCDEFLHLYGVEKMQERINDRLPLYQKVFNLFTEGVDVKNPEQVSLLEERLFKFCEKITNKILQKNYYTYFKNQIFAAKSFKKIDKKDKLFLSLKSINIKPRDAILFLLLRRFPEILKSDIYLENFVPFESLEVEKELNLSINSSSYHSDICQQILKNYSLNEAQNFEDAINLYQQIYGQYLAEKLQNDIAKALKKQDFTLAKLLKDELTKIKLENLKTRA